MLRSSFVTRACRHSPALLLIVLIARVLLALGPDGTVLCVHEGGGVFVESTAALCCARTECASSRAASGATAPTSPDDDCHDYALTTGDALAAPDHAPLVVLSPILVSLETTAPVPAPFASERSATLALASTPRFDPGAPRATTLRF